MRQSEGALSQHILSGKYRLRTGFALALGILMAASAIGMYVIDGANTFFVAVQAFCMGVFMTQHVAIWRKVESE